MRRPDLVRPTRGGVFPSKMPPPEACRKRTRSGGGKALPVHREPASARPAAAQSLRFAPRRPQAAGQTSRPRKRPLGTFTRVLFKAGGLWRWAAGEKGGLAGKLASNASPPAPGFPPEPAACSTPSRRFSGLSAQEEPMLERRKDPFPTCGSERGLKGAQPKGGETQARGPGREVPLEGGLSSGRVSALAFGLVLKRKLAAFTQLGRRKPPSVA